MEHKCKKTDLKTVEKCELKRDLIIKALECCTSSDKSADCPIGCPFGDINSCEESLMYHALSLIKELTEEVASWKAIAEGYQKQFEDCAEDRARLTEENERLRVENVYGLSATKLAKKVEELSVENEKLIDELAKSYNALDESMNFYCSFTQSKVSNCPIDDEVAKAKADTVRKMQERLNETKFKMLGYEIIYAENIDQIAKEMLEGEK